MHCQLVSGTVVSNGMQASKSVNFTERRSSKKTESRTPVQPAAGTRPPFRRCNAFNNARNAVDMKNEGAGALVAARQPIASADSERLDVIHEAEEDWSMENFADFELKPLDCEVDLLLSGSPTTVKPPNSPYLTLAQLHQRISMYPPAEKSFVVHHMVAMAAVSDKRSDGKWRISRRQISEEELFSEDAADTLASPTPGSNPCDSVNDGVEDDDDGDVDVARVLSLYFSRGGVDFDLVTPTAKELLATDSILITMP